MSFLISLNELSSETLPECKGTLELLRVQWPSKTDHILSSYDRQTKHIMVFKSTTTSMRA